MAKEKTQLRQRYRREREERFVSESFSLLLSAPEIKAAKIIATYISYGVEPSTQEINRALLSQGVRLLIPRIEGQNLRWMYWLGDEASLTQVGKFLEPTGEAINDLSQIDVVIVPSLHIDHQGYRLGQGGGFYDRALPQMSGWKVGLVHSGEITNEPLPRENHDIPLSAGATPEIIVRFTH